MLKGADLDKLFDGYGDCGFNDPVPDLDELVDKPSGAKTGSGKVVQPAAGAPPAVAPKMAPAPAGNKQPEPYTRPPVLGATPPPQPGMKPELVEFNQAMDQAARKKGYADAEQYNQYLQQSGAYDQPKDPMEETQLAPGIKKAPAYMPPGAYPGDRTKVGKAYDKEVEEGPPVAVKSKPAVSIDSEKDGVESSYVKQSDNTYASRPREGNKVTIRLEEGGKSKVCDFEMGSLDLPWALEVSLRKMKVGDIMDVEGRGEYAVAEREVLKPGIKRKWQVELMAVDTSKKDDKFSLSSDERIIKANGLRLRGNDLFKKGRFQKAMELYEEGSKYMDVLECEDMGGMGKVDKAAAERNQKIWACQKPLLLNWALILIKLGRYAEAERKCTEVLMDIDKLNVKALFRRGQCNVHLGRPEQAKTDLERAAELDTSIKDEVARELEKVGTIQKVVDKRDTGLAKRVVDGYVKTGDERSDAPAPKEDPKPAPGDTLAELLQMQEKSAEEQGLDEDSFCRQREALYNQFLRAAPATMEQA